MRASLAPILAALMLAQAPLAALADTPQPRLVVTGEGRSEAAPDIATITLGVTTQADTADAALAENNTRLATVLENLRAAGIADRDLQTSGLSLGPRYDYSREGQAPRVVGYEASNTLTVRVRALDSLGTVLDKAVADGANTFQGLSFGLADPTAALDAARVAAVEEARRKAGLMARAAGVTLGPVLEITEATRMPEPYMMARGAAAKADSVPVAGGEVSYAAEVTITYALAD